MKTKSIEKLLNHASDVFEAGKHEDRLDGSPLVCEGDMIALANAREEIAVLRTENARLREALQAIQNDCQDYIDDNDGPGPVETMQAMRECARAALAERGEA